MYNKTISWNDNWILIFYVGRLHLDHSALSSSSFMESSFLIQMTRIEFFIFLIAWGIFFEWWELDLQLLPSSSSLLMSWAEINYFLLAYILCMNPMILGGHSRWPSSLLHSSLTTSSCFLIWETLVKYDCMVSAFWIFTSFNYFLKVIFWFMFFP